MEEMTNLGTPDKTAETMRHIDGVARVAQVSSKLKGTGKKTLNEAALNAKAALTTLAIRVQKLENETTSAKEMETMRRQLKLLKADNVRLSAEAENYRQSLVDMEREMERLRTSLKDIKEGKRGEQPPLPP